MEIEISRTGADHRRTHKQVLDTPVYQRYGDAIAHGQVPYRDFALEYPPGALPMFALPGLAEQGHGQDVTAGFRHLFETLMWFCGAIALLGMAAVLRVSGASRAHVWSALLFAALAPLALGSVLLSRYDLWPTALVVASLAALVTGRLRLGGGVLGAAITAKLFPAVLVPLAVAFAWRRQGRREAVICLATICAVVAVVFAPFVALSPAGVWHSLTDQLTRPLFYWAAFVFLDLSAGTLGMALERRAPWGDLVWLPIQRFGYRQLMYYVVVKSIDAALHGVRVGWGKLERRATAVAGAG